MIQLSALQHAVFCMRQCALIHLEGTWTENSLTVGGRVLHERVDRREHETRRSIRLATAVRLSSHRLGVTGIADMIEFHRCDDASGDADAKTASPLVGAPGLWRPFPIEYKRGKPKSHRADEVQLCAQAMCLEEMLNVVVPAGALFYGEMRRRVDVAFDEGLRSFTVQTAEAVHWMLAGREIPSAERGKWCDSCSLVDDCLPDSQGRSARAWIDRRMAEALA